MKLWWLAAVLVWGCAAAGDGRDAAQVGPLGRVTPRLRVDAALLEPAGQALALWSEASGGQYAPTLTDGDAEIRIVLVDEITCGEYTDGLSGCEEQGLIRIKSTVPVELRVSTVAHELGHSLGLLDGVEGLMNPRRSRAERLALCVRAEDVAAVGWTGVDACL